MTGTTPERDALAAEWALRILADDEARDARALEVSDAGFALAVAAWEEAFAPLFDEIAPVEPDPAMLDRILAGIARLRLAEGPAAPSAANDDAVSVRRGLRFWRGTAAAMTALAASLALVLGLRAGRETAPAPQPVPVALAVAAIAPAEPTTGPPLAIVSYDRTSRSLVVTPAAIGGAAGRARELWVVPASGKPRSLGLVQSGTRRIVLADSLARELTGSPTLAISDEQAGGSRTGSPVGPVVATGKLLPV